ncbi:MAG: nuclear transport factor 2 family protein [Pseudomonadota bacterium]
MQQLINRYLEAWRSGDVPAILALYGPGFCYHDLTEGIVVSEAEIERFLRETFALEGKSPIEFHDIVTPNSSTVFIHWTQLLKTPGRRSRVRTSGVELLIIDAEKIVSVHEFYDSQPADLEGAQLTDQNEQLKKLGLTPADAAAIATQAQAYLKHSQAYLDPDINLNSVSSAIGVTRNQLSHVLNASLNTSFYDWINAQRIAHVTAYLDTQPKTFSAVAAAMDAGFNSVSGFYAAFKKHKGTTPNSYRKAQSAAEN